MTTKRLSVVLVDHQVMVRRLIRRFLEESGMVKVNGEATGLVELEALMQRWPSEAAMVSATLPNHEVFPVVRYFQHQHPQMTVVVAGIARNKRRWNALLAAGASRCVPHSGSTQDLLDALQGYGPDPISVPLPPPGPLFLSPPQMDVMRLVANGLTNPEIANHLNVSLSTVKRTLAEIFYRLRVTTRTQAVLRLAKEGLLPDSPSTAGVPAPLQQVSDRTTTKQGDMSDSLEERFRRAAPAADFCSLRLVDEQHDFVSVRRGVLEPMEKGRDVGVMLTVVDGGGMGYAATSDLSESGLRHAAGDALEWARRTASRSVVDYARIPLPHSQGEYETPVRIGWDSVPLRDKIQLLKEQNEHLKIDDRIVDWEASLWHVRSDTLYLTTDGGRLSQRFFYLVPTLSVTAHETSETQTRTLQGQEICRQGGLEVLDDCGYRTAATQVAHEALQLLAAPDCPTGLMDVLLDADQMILQIHESIGHPLELDRILGDERNYAGTSFVTLDMFGTYRYGSDLLNITYDPTRKDQFASFGWDDEGLPARKEYIIRNGLLERPLGGVVSQARAGLAGVANARACSWNRPPIDRMANLNLEAGTSSLDDMVSAVEHGVYLKSNNSWSIDDSRNKFQFGCEWGQRIENGRLGAVVKNPGYRGVSATFWRNLKMVGLNDTVQYLGTPFCGKGEPNQSIRVGHASPACLFSAVDVFGGA